MRLLDTDPDVRSGSDPLILAAWHVCRGRVAPCRAVWGKCLTIITWFNGIRPCQINGTACIGSGSHIPYLMLWLKRRTKSFSSNRQQFLSPMNNAAAKLASTTKRRCHAASSVGPTLLISESGGPSPVNQSNRRVSTSETGGVGDMYFSSGWFEARVRFRAFHETWTALHS